MWWLLALFKKNVIVDKVREKFKTEVPQGVQETDDLLFEFDCDRAAPQNEVIDSQILSGNCQPNLDQKDPYRLCLFNKMLQVDPAEVCSWHERWYYCMKSWRGNEWTNNKSINGYVLSLIPIIAKQIFPYLYLVSEKATADCSGLDNEK